MVRVNRSKDLMAVSRNKKWEWYAVVRAGFMFKCIEYLRDMIT